MWKSICGWILICGLAMTTSADVYLVDPYGTGDFPTIQDAILAASDGDVIELTDGTFRGDGNRDIDFLGKAISVQSQSFVPQDCIIDCEGTFEEPHRGFAFVSGEGPDSYLGGVTIMNGYARHGPWPEGNGGGVYCHSSSPVINECILANNTAEWSGGGMWYGEGAAPEMNYCTFEGNAAPGGGGGLAGWNGGLAFFMGLQFIDNHSHGEYGGGGGMYLENTPAVLNDFTFRENSADFGGGLCCLAGSDAYVTGTFDGNQAYGDYGGFGGGMLFFDCAPTMVACTLIHNGAEQSGGGMYCSSAVVDLEQGTFSGNSAGLLGSGIYCDLESALELRNTIIAFGADPPAQAVACDGSSLVNLTCCDVYGNAGGDWVGCIAGQDGINGNISEDPLFCRDANPDWPYTLYDHSPCAPFTPPNPECDLIGAWPVGCELQQRCGDLVWTYDPCEFCGQDAFYSTTYTEMNHDCFVDDMDFALFYQDYTLMGEGLSGDFNRDGVVNIIDFAHLVTDYGFEVSPCDPCGEQPDDCAGRIRVDFDSGFGDIDRIDLPAGTDYMAYVVGEDSPGCAGVHLLVYVTPNIYVRSVLFPSDITLFDSTVPFYPWPDESAYLIATVEFTVLDALPAAIGVRGSTPYPELGSLRWIQFPVPWPPEEQPPAIRYMGYETISYAGVNGDPPPDSLGCGSGDVPLGDERARAPRLALGPGQPNPFGLSTRISYGIPAELADRHVSLCIYDPLGRLVRTLVDAPGTPGLHAATWDGTNFGGKPLRSGIYFCRFQVGNEGISRRLLLLR